MGTKWGTLGVMHLIVDAREAFSPQRTGKGEWSFHVIQELLRRSGVRCTLLTDRPVDGLGGGSRVVVLPTGWRWHLAAQTFVRGAHDVTAYVSPTSYIVPFLLGKSVPTVVVVHDLIAFRPEPHALRPRLLERLTLPRVVRTAALLCTASETTSRDLLGYFPRARHDKVVAVFAGPVQDAGAQSAKPDVVLSLGTLCPRKNQLRLTQAYAKLPAALRERYPLVVVGGRGWQDEAILREIERTPGARWEGYLRGDALDALWSRAAVLAMPSLYEGFGMPVLTAMQRGIPVLASSRGSLIEVTGDAAVSVDPLSVESIADGLLRLLQEEPLRERLVQEGKKRAQVFSWERTVGLVVEGIERAC